MPASVLWTMEANSIEQLTPPGLIGELLIEGLVVSSGYLVTSAVIDSGFVEAPKRLRTLRGHHTAVYRTGYLVEHSVDGSLCFKKKIRSSN